MYPDGVLVYDPAVAVRHKVPKARTSWTYFRARCFAEGLSKAAVARRVGTDSGLSAERNHLRRTWPAGVRAGLRSIPSDGAAAGLGRSIAILAGVAMTATGYGWGRWCGARGTVYVDAPLSTLSRATPPEGAKAAHRPG